MKEYLKYEDVIKVLFANYPKADSMISAVVCLAFEKEDCRADSTYENKVGE